MATACDVLTILFDVDQPAKSLERLFHRIVGKAAGMEHFAIRLFRTTPSASAVIRIFKCRRMTRDGGRLF